MQPFLITVLAVSIGLVCAQIGSMSNWPLPGTLLVSGATYTAAYALIELVRMKRNSK